VLCTHTHKDDSDSSLSLRLERPSLMTSALYQLYGVQVNKHYLSQIYF